MLINSKEQYRANNDNLVTDCPLATLLQLNSVALLYIFCLRIEHSFKIISAIVCRNDVNDFSSSLIWNRNTKKDRKTISYIK